MSDRQEQIKILKIQNSIIQIKDMLKEEDIGQITYSGIVVMTEEFLNKFYSSKEK